MNRRFFAEVRLGKKEGIGSDSRMARILEIRSRSKGDGWEYIETTELAQWFGKRDEALSYAHWRAGWFGAEIHVYPKGEGPPQMRYVAPTNLGTVSGPKSGTRHT